MRIGELADATGVSVRSLRYYEEQGLIRSDRRGNGWRDFPVETIERVVMVQHLLAAGLAPPPSTSFCRVWRPLRTSAPVCSSTSSTRRNGAWRPSAETSIGRSTSCGPSGATPAYRRVMAGEAVEARRPDLTPS